MISKTCGEYVLQRLDALERDNETLREENDALHWKLDRYRDRRMSICINAGRKRYYSSYVNLKEPKVGEPWDEWCSRVVMWVLLPKEFGGLDGFLDFFGQELQDDYDRLSAERDAEIDC